MSYMSIDHFKVPKSVLVLFKICMNVNVCCLVKKMIIDEKIVRLITIVL